MGHTKECEEDLARKYGRRLPPLGGSSSVAPRSNDSDERLRIATKAIFDAIIAELPARVSAEVKGYQGQWNSQLGSFDQQTKELQQRALGAYETVERLVRDHETRWSEQASAQTKALETVQRERMILQKAHDDRWQQLKSEQDKQLVLLQRENKNLREELVRLGKRFEERLGDLQSMLSNLPAPQVILPESAIQVSIAPAQGPPPVTQLIIPDGAFQIHTTAEIPEGAIQNHFHAAGESKARARKETVTKSIVYGPSGRPEKIVEETREE